MAQATAPLFDFTNHGLANTRPKIQICPLLSNRVLKWCVATNAGNVPTGDIATFDRGMTERQLT